VDRDQGSKAVVEKKEAD